MSLTFLIHQQGFWSTLWNTGIHLRFPFQTCVEFLVEKWEAGRKQSSRTGFWVGISQEHTVMRLLHTFPRAILNEALWHLKTPCDGEKRSLRKKARKQASKQNALNYPLLFSLWGEGRVWSHCNYKDLYIWLWTFIQPFTSRVALSLPGIGCKSTALQPYQEVLLNCLRVKNAFWCRDFHWGILTCRWRHWQQREADCPSWRITRTVSPVCSFLRPFLKNSVP